ncbi:FapA family protein [Desulfosarcina cetonica]|uniref:FapA family protein n=1 Tax=Desulfosarcina cetonica TaxID=90730 RepID=UPI0006D1B74B|nr:FapA family protein [Desulfosarcina cetonica]
MQRNLKAGHVKGVDAILTGDIAVEREIIESSIEANGRCLIIDGTIIASTISAKMGITAMDIGTEASKSSDLVVGIDRQLEREANAIKSQIQDIKAEQERLKEKIEGLTGRSDEINTQLGKVAQEQDGFMVQHRRLEEKAQTNGVKQSSETQQKLKKALAELKAKQAACDDEVARLMEEDDRVRHEISEIEQTTAANRLAIEDLNRSLNEVNEAQKDSLGLPVVKAAGTIYAGTRMKGPHAKLTLLEDFKRVSIIETDKPDHEGAKRWRFELNPFK